MRSMYAMWPTSLTPVAEQYTARAMGSAFCSSMTAVAILVLCPSLPGTKFFALHMHSNCSCLIGSNRVSALRL